MKQIFHFILIGFTLSAMFAGCSSKNEIPQANKDVVELRYRVESEYQLPARDAAPFTIVVKSSRPWSIASQHPDWCIIGQEEGEAVDGALVHEGKGESTSVKVQYYDNTDLDDRIDKIEIASDYLVAKTVTVYQRGIAYLNVPEADIEGGLFVEKPQGSVTINIKANQKWSTKILPYEGGTTDWLSISEGETGELDGTVTVAVKENTGEKRYAFVGVYDRHDEERWLSSISPRTVSSWIRKPLKSALAMIRLPQPSTWFPTAHGWWKNRESQTGSVLTILPATIMTETSPSRCSQTRTEKHSVRAWLQSRPSPQIRGIP